MERGREAGPSGREQTVMRLKVGGVELRVGTAERGMADGGGWSSGGKQHEALDSKGGTENVVERQ